MGANTLTDIIILQLGNWLNQLQLTNYDSADEIADFLLQLPKNVLQSFVENQFKDRSHGF